MVKAFLLSVVLSFITFSASNYAQETSQESLNQADCETSVSNIQKSIKKHKIALRKQTARSLSNIEKNIIRTALAELNSKVSVEHCLASKGKFQEGYLCMLEKSDIQDCKMNSDKDN